MSEVFQTTADRLRAEGRAEGRAAGRIEGEIAARAALVLRALAGRKLPVSEAICRRILACNDRDTLDGWFDRALVAAEAVELFVDDAET